VRRTWACRRPERNSTEFLGFMKSTATAQERARGKYSRVQLTRLRVHPGNQEQHRPWSETHYPSLNVSNARLSVPSSVSSRRKRPSSGSRSSESSPARELSGVDGFRDPQGILGMHHPARRDRNHPASHFCSAQGPLAPVPKPDFLDARSLRPQPFAVEAKHCMVTVP
jgi:hypothetical protein